ncbi:MAG TPA: HEPN domain-containing protein [Thermoguttaceae bacterium]|nr:HEPN domain-containing protein [Thermoguttaceae bacterium]
MNPETVRQWIAKAEHDWKIALDELATADPVSDMVCFHLQQCCEKYLKAFLISHGREHPRTHRLEVLIHLCTKIDPEFQILRAWESDQLSRYATVLRYGEEFYMPSQQETQQAIAVTEKVRQFVSQKLQQNVTENPDSQPSPDPPLKD